MASPALTVRIDGPDVPIAIGEHVSGVVEVVSSPGGAVEVELSAGFGYIHPIIGETLWEGLLALEAVTLSRGDPAPGALLPFSIQIPTGAPPSFDDGANQVVWVAGAGILGLLRSEEQEFTVASETVLDPAGDPPRRRWLPNTSLLKSSIQRFRAKQAHEFRVRAGERMAALRPPGRLRLIPDRRRLAAGDEVRVRVEVPDKARLASLEVGLVAAVFSGDGPLSTVRETWRPVDTGRPAGDLAFRVDPAGPCSVEGLKRSIVWCLKVREDVPPVQTVMSGSVDASAGYLWVDPRRRQQS